MRLDIDCTAAGRFDPKRHSFRDFLKSRRKNVTLRWVVVAKAVVALFLAISKANSFRVNMNPVRVQFGKSCEVCIYSAGVCSRRDKVITHRKVTESV